MQPRSLPSTLDNIPVSIEVGDTRTRKSWGWVKVSCPRLQIEIEDWFHFCTTDGEFIRAGYGFTLASKGIATDEQLVEILGLISDRAIEKYLYRAGKVIVDRFSELDKEEFFK
jgi:hypothetical protein